jgi:tRNA (cmo5U34)-methyltransferase
VSNGAVDNVLPEDRWAFDAEVAEVFDDMLARSIPQYDVMRRAVADVGAAMLGNVNYPIRILDLGTSRGAALEEHVRRFGARGQFVGVEVSQPMITAARSRFEAWSNYVEIRNFDLRTGFPSGPWDLIQSVLTLQFVPIEHRERIVADAYDSLVTGGAFIIVEKVLGENRLDEMFSKLYYEMKSEAGYSTEQIERKRLALEGVLVPITAAWNVDLLRSAGFGPVDCFWRWMNFAAWIAIKR